ncbi:hypothetical protein LWI29_017417 [Acer saccharum]|uniref:Protein kinase domain-containing protein n=1 Tax=Acer saccharum TaxID=4024 RepID=A0AA39ST42_ACESA|nr:hypothetical protein LWI29_017417 [Acer saccharum]
MNIKTKYGVKNNWQGDPCAPIKYLWQGVNCSDFESNPPRIISLNLSSSGISGNISPFISNLSSIQYLDLSNNSLTGPVPDFLLQLPFLTMLNLSGNDLKGSVPVGLIEKQKSGLLSLSVDGNPDLCLSTSCTKKKTIVVPVLASFLAVSVLIAAALSILWILKARIQGITWNKNNRSLELKNRRFSYSDVVRITNNFERIVGQGGFGTVYHGNLDDHTQVAVKMLSLSSIQGHKQFQTEVELLLRVHHKNLTSLVGYCDNGTNMGLIYEFMSNGNLESHLLGLEYLHSGCKPPIVHRDVKPTNILLNEKFQAKMADFGLSRIFPVESETHVSTIVAGTPGYLDPEYYKSNRLTEKSDVYSFGVVLLQIITSKPAIEKSEARTHIIEWVSFMLEKGDIKNVVDPRLQGDFDTNSVWRAVEVAMACVSQTSAKRPTMNQVVIDLNESLEIEIARTNVGRETESRSISLNLHSVLLPDARSPVGHNFGISRGNGLPSGSVKFAKGSRGISPGTFPEQVNRQEARSFVDVVKEDRFWKPGNRGDHSDSIHNLSWSASREDKIASVIRVRVGSRVVHIRMEESSDPISGDWLNKILGLNSKSAASLDSVHEVSSGASEEGEWGLVERCQSQPDRLEVRKEVFGGVSEKEAKMGVGSGMNRIGGDKSVRASFNGSFESSSSDEESEGRCLMRSGVGECSKAKIIEPCNDKVIRPSEDGPGGLGKQQVMVQQSGNSSSPVKDCSGALANLGEGGSSPKAHSTLG